MKNHKYTCIAILVALTAGTASAQSMANQDFYGELGYTSLNIKNDNNGFDIAPKLMRVVIGKELNKALSVEGAYAFTTSKDSDMVGQEKYTGKASMYGVYLKPKFEITNGVEAFARVGVIHTKYEDEGSDVSKTKASYGLGLQAQFTKDIHGQLDYMNYYKHDGMTGKGFTLSIGTRF
jgi:opacity protein-like surface antigen